MPPTGACRRPAPGPWNVGDTGEGCEGKLRLSGMATGVPEPEYTGKEALLACEK
jgi:hypothetical protein